LFDSIIVFENQPVDQALKAWNDADLQFDDIADVGLTNFAMDLMVSLTDCCPGRDPRYEKPKFVA